MIYGSSTSAGHPAAHIYLRVQMERCICAVKCSLHTKQLLRSAWGENADWGANKLFQLNSEQRGLLSRADDVEHLCILQ